MAMTNAERVKAWRERQLADPDKAKVYREKRAATARGKAGRDKAEIERLKEQLMAEHLEIRDGDAEGLPRRLLERYAADKDRERRENLEERKREEVLYERERDRQEAMGQSDSDRREDRSRFVVRTKPGKDEWGLEVEDLADDTMGRALMAFLQTIANEHPGIHPLDPLGPGTRDMLIRWLSKDILIMNDDDETRD